MVFDFIYETNAKRLMPAIINDSWSIIPQIKGQPGASVKAYSDSQVALVTSNCLLYKIESVNGNLAGYFVLQVNNSAASLYLLQLRPAFQSFTAQISQNINIFVQSNNFLYDMLY